MGKGESRRKISNRNSGLLTGKIISTLPFDGGVNMLVATFPDVTLNDCANNPRKARIGKAKIGLEVVGKVF